MIRPLAVLLLCLAAPPALAQAHTHKAPTVAEATQPGQSAFAAIAEIVALLRADPNTDWSRVDIPALRAHLVDMDLVTTRATVETTPEEDGATFRITGDGPIRDAIQAMALAHPPFAEAETGWTIAARATADGVVWQVAGDRETILALGFHGLLTLGAHHPEHHLALARGDTPHH